MSSLQVSHVPSYEKILRKIKSQIQEGTYANGEALLSEAKLCEIFSVSRVTIRRSIEELAKSGYVEKVQGKGTFVKYQRLEQELLTIEGFSEVFSQKGYKVTHRVISTAVITPDSATREQFSMHESEKIMKIVRVHYLNDNPFCIDSSYLREQQFPGILSELNDEKSLYEIMKSAYGFVPNHSERSIVVTFPSDEDSNLLACDASEPLFKMEKLVFVDKKPIHKSILLSPCSRVVLKVKM